MITSEPPSRESLVWSEFGAMLAERRQQSGLSKEGFAASLGVSVTTLNEIEAGRRTRLAGGTRQKLETVFGGAVPRAKKTEYICLRCGNSFTAWPSQQQLYCSKCGRKPRLEHVSRTALALFLVRKVNAPGTTLTQLSAEIGIARATLRGYITKGRLPTQANYERLRACFGKDLPDTPTETERRRRIAAEVSEKGLAKAHTPEAKKKSAASRKGKAHTPERVAKRLAAARESGGFDRSMAALAAKVKTGRHRALAALIGHLRANPTPSRDDIQRWARETAQHLTAQGLDDTPEAVVARWRPYLRKRGLVSKAGRPALEDRHRLIAELMTDWPRTESGRLAKGFWPRVAKAVGELEGLKGDCSCLPLNRTAAGITAGAQPG